MTKTHKRKFKVALPPGTYEKIEGQVSKIRLIDYNEQVVVEKELSKVQDCFEYRDSPTISWINIDGRDIEVIKKVDQHFGIHPLVLEDIMNIGQRPKVEEYDGYIFFVIKMVYFDELTGDLASEQVSLILGENYVISFQETEGDIFDPIRQRIRDGKGRIRQMGADYLMYALLDAVVDNYFVILEQLGEHIDQLEKELFKNLNPEMPRHIHKLKNKVIYLRKHIWPLREVLSNFQRSESLLIQKTTDIYLRDVYDHAIRVNDSLEAFREGLSGLHDIYLSSISNRMNEVMKVLTIFAAIFIPLTFIAGIYGMNFDNMPELHYPHAYYIALGVMAALGFGMLLYFKKRNWL